ncbi:ribosomal-protein-alanine N-acetyltransferase [Tepidamorphus gemmatus]|uniref:Ribosomal-protein-alanine N-acetyltransferase n=1 Tax=Tepidamorphus gemmatus TaxID=747076 RepID=A0A4R3ME81_9HYPH|nr:GNAT family N-acetyltransferase [Tepidamorphus gemmatus]TCT11970.1 ribosomal-protein-alanine N-acetyltransferase [Tepidamorphus gemmatus]
MSTIGLPRRLAPGDAAEAARLHAAAMTEPWGADAWQSLLADPAVTGFGVGESWRLAGALLLRSVLDEAEILMLCVAPEARRRGLGRALVAAALETAARNGARRVYLEVAVDNAAALSLYGSIGFREAGRRKGYYRRPAGRVDALLLARPGDLEQARRGG